MIRSFWRVNVPQIGFAHPYVLHGLAALAALHLARFRPEQRAFYVDQARICHTKASAMALPLLPSIDPDSCIPLYFFSVLTSYISFASPKEPGSFLFADGGNMPDWFFLFRGVRTVIDAGAKQMYHSSIAILFSSGLELHAVWQTHSLNHEALRELECNIRNSVSLRDDDKKDILLTTVSELKRAFYIFYSNQFSDENKHRSVFIFLYKASDDYFNLIKDHDKEALCILAFFCALMNHLEHYWWMEGWALRLISRIYASLDDIYRFWIRWPIEEMGWVPNLDLGTSSCPQPSAPDEYPLPSII